ncbi:hypothetical protein D3C78_1263970 [compost metagenome]
MGDDTLGTEAANPADGNSIGRIGQLLALSAAFVGVPCILSQFECSSPCSLIKIQGFIPRRKQPADRIAIHQLLATTFHQENFLPACQVAFLAAARNHGHCPVRKLTASAHLIDESCKQLAVHLK